MQNLVLITCLVTGGVSNCEYRVVSGVFDTPTQCQTGAALIAGMSENKMVSFAEDTLKRRHGLKIYLPNSAYEFGYRFTCRENGTRQPWVTKGSALALKDFASAD